MRRGVILQDITGMAPAEVWQAGAAAGSTHALIGVPWPALQPEPGIYRQRGWGERVRAAQETGLQVILRLTWPLPDWCPPEWAARNAAGDTTRDRALFYRIGQCPSMWADAAWEQVWEAQEFLARQFPGAEFSPPGAGGGEWTHPTSHVRPGAEEGVQRALWCFDPAAVADWRRSYAAGLVGHPTAPTGFPDAYRCPGFTRWYQGALVRRLRQAVQRTPGTAWIAPILKPGYIPETVAAGQPGLEFHLASLRCHVLLHCVFGPGNSLESQDHALNSLHLWRGNIGVGVERWTGLARNVPRLWQTPCSHLLLDVAGLDQAEGRDALQHFAGLWRNRRKS